MTIKISDLPLATTIAKADEVPIVQDGETKRVPFPLIVENGNLSLSASMEAWNSSKDVVQLGAHGAFVSNTTAGSLEYANNAFLDASSVWRYRDAGAATLIQQTSTGITLNVAASGAAEAPITWIVAQTIDLTGNVTYVGSLSGVTQLNVDNLRVDGNTVSSTNTNGDINLTPNGSGSTVIPSLKFIQSGTGAVARTVQDKSRDIVSAFDFLTPAEISDVQARTLLVDIGTNYQKALDSGAARVFTPEGSYLHATGFTPPNGVTVIGANNPGTLFKYTGTGNAFKFGTSDSVLNIGCSIRDCRINLNDKASVGILLNATNQAKVDNIYIEALYQPFDNTRTNVAVIVDGRNVSAFGNEINVRTNHMHESFRVTTTGTVNATSQYFRDCFMFGDGTTDSTSIGYNIAGTVTGGGNGTQIMGGYIEAYAVGIDILANNGAINVIGTTFENAASDIDLRLASGVENCSFIGLIDCNRIVDNSAGDNLFIDRRGRIGIGVNLSGTLDQFPASLNIKDGIKLTNKAQDGTQTADILTDGTNTGNTGKIRIQAGNASAAYGAGITLHGHNHASRAGDLLLGMSVGANGRIAANPSGIGGARSTDLWWIDANGDMFLPSPTVPSIAAATGTAGQVSWDASYIYICVATNTWKRVGIAAW